MNDAHPDGTFIKCTNLSLFSFMIFQNVLYLVSLSMKRIGIPNNIFHDPRESGTRHIDYRIYSVCILKLTGLWTRKQFATGGFIVQSRQTRDNQLYKVDEAGALKPLNTAKLFFFFSTHTKSEERDTIGPGRSIHLNWDESSVFRLHSSAVSSSLFRVALHVILCQKKRPKERGNSIKRSTRVHGHSCI